MKLPKLVSLFSGSGGLDSGFIKAGFDIAFASDVDKWSIETYRKNIPAVNTLKADLLEIGVDGIVESIEEFFVDGERIGIIGGPPCQGFSRSNRGGLENDPRNILTHLYVDVIEELMKKYIVEFVIFENVLGLRDKRHDNTLEKIISRLEAMGVFCVERNCCALDFGVPQKRNRVIIAAFRSLKQREHYWPVEIATEDLSVSAAIGSLPEPVFYHSKLRPNDIPFHPNHWTMNPRSAKFSPDYVAPASSRSFRRLKWDQPSPTVAYGHREIHVHPSGVRRLSIYEAMILQGFPSEYVLMGSLSAQVEQVSNAVPPPMGYGIALGVKEALGHGGGY